MYAGLAYVKVEARAPTPAAAGANGSVEWFLTPS